MVDVVLEDSLGFRWMVVVPPVCPPPWPAARVAFVSLCDLHNS